RCHPRRLRGRLRLAQPRLRGRGRPPGHGAAGLPPWRRGHGDPLVAGGYRPRPGPGGGDRTRRLQRVAGRGRTGAGSAAARRVPARAPAAGGCRPRRIPGAARACRCRCPGAAAGDGAGGTGRHRLPAARLAGADADPAGPDPQLRRNRRGARPAARGPRRGPRLRQQPGGGAGALPPGHPRRWQPGRLSLGPAAQARTAGPGIRAGHHPRRSRPPRMTPHPSRPSPPVWAVAAALASVYLVWGSTYVAIRYGLEGFPPFLMGGLRFIAAGGAFYLFLRWRGHAAPTRAQWRNAFVMGLFMMLLGNGLVNVAEQTVSSGLAAVAVASMPLWAGLFGALRGQHPGRLEWLGLAVGFLGVVWLNLGSDISASAIG